MKLIVDISERDYNTVVTALEPRMCATLMQEAIANGVPIPRGYKRPTEDNIEVGPVFDKEGLLMGYKYTVKEDLDSAEIIFPAPCPLIHSLISKEDKSCAIHSAIEELEQEPVLDKIRAELEEKCCITVGRENDPAITLYDVFQIIDKYRKARVKE